jgi:hypothetical protein
LHSACFSPPDSRDVPYFFGRLVDALARAFSPHYLVKPTHVRTIQEMPIDSVISCRRDLLLRGVLAERVWDAIVQWSANPLFQLDKRNVNSRSNVLVLVNEGSSSVEGLLDVLKEHQDLLDNQPVQSSSLQIVTRGQPPAVQAQRMIRQEVLGGYATNVASVGRRTEEVLRLQENVTLAFNVTAFNADYKEALRVADEERRALDELGIDPELPAVPRRITIQSSGSKASSTRRRRRTTKDSWSIRDERVFYASIAHVVSQTSLPDVALQASPSFAFDEEKYRRHAVKWPDFLRDRAVQKDQTCLELSASMHTELSAQQLFAVAQAGGAWRVSARKRLERFDLAQAHMRAFRSVWEKTQTAEGIVPIRTSYSCLHTRRFQAESFWPSFVTSRRSWSAGTQTSLQELYLSDAESDAAADPTGEALRSRWFKALASDDRTEDLSGYDVASSQMQIIAAFLGDSTLENLATYGARSFKEQMAAFAMSFNPPVLVHSMESGYTGPNDARLQLLAKELLMRVCYGSAARQVLYDQRQRQHEFGPGWTDEGIKRYLNAVYEKCPLLPTFLDIGRYIAESVCNDDPSSGVVVRNPFEGAKICWNPVASKEVVVDFGRKKLYLKVPVGIRDSLGPYPVSRKLLRNSFTPCLIQMLEAYYSALVMQKLSDAGCTTFVGIHDCWLVPRSQIALLKLAMEHAAREWYLGIGCVYEDLSHYLASNPKYQAIVREAWIKWEHRNRAGYFPQFFAKSTDAV